MLGVLAEGSLEVRDKPLTTQKNQSLASGRSRSTAIQFRTNRSNFAEFRRPQTPSHPAIYRHLPPSTAIAV
jgi:hypothetical protein